jgi:hypothetical protein
MVLNSENADRFAVEQHQVLGNAVQENFLQRMLLSSVSVDGRNQDFVDI